MPELPTGCEQNESLKSKSPTFRWHLETTVEAERDEVATALWSHVVVLVFQDQPPGGPVASPWGGSLPRGRGVSLEGGSSIMLSPDGDHVMVGALGLYAAVSVYLFTIWVVRVLFTTGDDL